MLKPRSSARLALEVERLLGSVPDLTRDLAVAFVTIGLAIGLRAMLEIFISGAVPFALTFPAVITAGLLAGFRAGLFSIVGCQLLVWYFILPPARSFAILNAGQAASLVLTTIAELVAVLAVSAYRGAAQDLRKEGARREQLLSVALKEIDHRTMNNFQIAVSLLLTQAASSASSETGTALRLAASRLASIAGTYRNLSVSSATLSEVNLDEHLRDLCEQLRKGLLPATAQLIIETCPLVVAADRAVTIGLIVNEWVTNAVKHSCADGSGTIRVSLASLSDHLVVSVDDDGQGAVSEPSEGQGSDLTAMLAQSIGARIEISRDPGYRCTLRARLINDAGADETI